MACYCLLAPDVCCNRCSYEPGPSFEEVEEEAMLDISPTDSEEFWLIQWPKDKLSAADFHGKEISLKLHNDGNLGTLESSSGKSYDIFSFASQQRDATVFLPSGSETKAGVVELNDWFMYNLNLMSLLSVVAARHRNNPFNWIFIDGSAYVPPGSSRKTMSRFTGLSKNRSSQGSALSLGAMSIERTPKPKKRKDESSLGHSNVPGRASEGSHARGAESNTASEMRKTTPEKSKKKKVKIAE
ncbi:hypothetical protein PR202_gb15560 [Eleusine coracana subsp. coracana]|uniref:Mediator-associated protein 2 n=1 Tax=Eleusine coracana subsp. coracana TaxID=191504 RepID=A0AAV5EXY5_ELECO|nr:hypothetical protein PR202_gb15560 [Eleusine coracana subsp. coracana]